MDSGKVFDVTKNYSQNSKSVNKLIEHYFKDSEIKGKNILDAGARVGDYSIQLLNKGAKKVVGIDLSRECVELAKKRYKKIKNLEFYQGDIRNLNKFKDNEFDIVICVGTIFYLPKKEMKIALNEFVRVTKPKGKVLVLFHKKKGFTGNTARFIANFLPLKIYLILVNVLAPFLKPIAEAMIKRKMTIDYLKNDILISLRGIHFGIPKSIPDKFKVKTVESEQASEETTASYKIEIPLNKKLLLD